MITKKLIVLSLVILCPTLLFAEDIVHLKNGTRYEGKVLAIHPETVELFMGENLPKRFIKKFEIKAIVYENGDVETFEEIKTESIEPKDKDIGVIKEKIIEREIKDSKTEGIATGVGICCALFIVLALIGSTGSSE